MMKKIFTTLAILFFAKTLMSVELHWKAVPLEYDMIVTAAVYIDDEEQQDEMLELGIFLGDEVRGSALPKYSPITKKYLYYVNVYNEELTASMTFKLYDHNTSTVLDLDCDQVLDFISDGDYGDDIEPYNVSFRTVITFTGSGDWNSPSNWENSKLPKETDYVIIDGDAVISGNITVNSLIINDGKSLTIQDGGILSVTSTLTNEDVNALIIEEGGQIFQTNANVAATFKNEIVIPTGIWGEEDNTGWQFVSSPVENVSTADFIPGDGDYDLYMYDGTSESQWVNFKQMGSQLYDFNTNPLENAWTSIDADGDGLNWEFDERDGFMYSYSYYDREDIYADNYLVSPAMTIQEGTTLSFKAYVTYTRTPETFKVLLSETSNANADCFTVELDSYEIDNDNELIFTIDLNDYAGKNVYIAFYHYLADDARNGSDRLIIDDVEFVNDNNFEKGRGYLVSYQNEGNIAEFKGDLNYLAEGESYQINLKYYADNLAQFNLVGNPFPFDVDWNTDININNVYDGFATLDAVNGGYVYNHDGIIKAGEGFMIKTLEGTENHISFSKDAKRLYREETNTINIVASNDKASDNVIIRFDDKEKSGFPKLRNFNDKIADIYMKDNDVNYAIMNYDNDVKEIPLYFDAKEMGKYTLTFDIEGDYETLYLLDKMTGEKVNVLLENEYIFTAASNDNSERFVLLTNAQTSLPEAHSNFAYINNGDIVIFDIDGDAQIRIIDALGRCVYNGECSDAASHVPTSGFANGVYMIQKIDDKGIKVQKIIL